MANADDLRALADDMVAAYNERMEAIASIKQETSHLLEEFNRLATERKKEIFNLKKDVSNMLEDFRKEREETASAWHNIVATMESKRAGSHPSVKTFKKKTHRRSEEPEKSK